MEILSKWYKLWTDDDDREKKLIKQFLKNGKLIKLISINKSVLA